MQVHSTNTRVESAYGSSARNYNFMTFKDKPTSEMYFSDIVTEDVLS